MERDTTMNAVRLTAHRERRKCHRPYYNSNVLHSAQFAPGGAHGYMDRTRVLDTLGDIAPVFWTL